MKRMLLTLLVLLVLGVATSSASAGWRHRYRAAYPYRAYYPAVVVAPAYVAPPVFVPSRGAAYNAYYRPWYPSYAGYGWGLPGAWSWGYPPYGGGGIGFGGGVMVGPGF